MKKYYLLFSLLCCIMGKSQEQSEIEKNENHKSLYIKGNVLFLPVLMLNAGAEYQLGEKYTLQGDVFISPWKSFAGKKAQVYMAGIEGRYYFNKAFDKFYVGANLSVATYNIQKWNYWKRGYMVSKTDENIKYDIKNYYQKGFAVIFGGTVGYQFQWKERWNVDLYLGVGSSQGFYRGYDEVSGLRIDELNAEKKRNYNRSGELIPYRGGVMISYKIK